VLSYAITSVLFCQVCIVAVAGLYRTGKSSLLNWLLGRNAGFTVGPSINRCTRGLWIWGKPVPGVLANGEPCSVIILDTEGIGGVEGDSKYDARIFSMAILLCSTLIYNSLGSIDENAISNLSFIAQLSQHIKLSSSPQSHAGKNDDEDDGDASEFCKIFPSFVWVVRDFTLQLEDEDGDEISPTQYLNKSLELTNGYDKQTLERNRTRSMLSAFFPERQCVTLVRPIGDEAALQQVDLVPYDDLREDFKKSMEVLQTAVFGTLRPKSIDNRPLNGPMFAGLVSAYVSAINAGGVPTISSAWEGVSRQECIDAKEEATKVYATEVKERCPPDRLPLEDEVLQTAHIAAESKALAAFKSRAVGVSARDFQADLQEAIDKSFASLREANSEASTVFCEGLVSGVYDRIIRANLDGVGGGEAVNGSLTKYASDISSFRSDWTSLFDEYAAGARGPSKWKVLSTFSRGRMLDCTQVIVNGIKSSYEDAVSGLKEEALRQSSALAAQEAQCRVMADKADGLEKEFVKAEAEIVDLTSRCESNGVQIEELTASKRSMQRERDEEKEVRVRCEARNAAMTERVKELEGKETECFELKTERDALKDRVAELEEELAAALAAKQKKKKCTIS
jgi:hypothetical protein